MPDERDRALHELARNQRGLFTLAQAVAAGLTDTTVYRRCAAGRYEQRRPGVFAVAGAPDSREARNLAAVLAVDSEEDPAVLSHASAAHHWELDGCEPDDVIHVLSRGHHPEELDGVRPHRTERLPETHRAERYGIPVTSAERTLCDLAGTVRSGALRRAIADAVRRELVTTEGLAATAFELGRFRGKRKLRAILAEMSPLEADAASALESLFLQITTLAGIAPSAMNHPVVDADGCRRKLDAVWLPEDRDLLEPVWAELDGMRWHTGSLDVNDDRRREDALMRAGWPAPLRYTWRDLVDRPEEVVGEIRAALLARRVPAHQRISRSSGHSM